MYILLHELIAKVCNMKAVNRFLGIFPLDYLFAALLFWKQGGFKIARPIGGKTKDINQYFNR